jgi:hypothetical protein
MEYPQRINFYTLELQIVFCVVQLDRPCLGLQRDENVSSKSVQIYLQALGSWGHTRQSQLPLRAGIYAQTFLTVLGYTESLLGDISKPNVASLPYKPRLLWLIHFYSFV